MSLLNILLKSLLKDNSLSALAKKTGLSKVLLKKLIPLAIPLLLKRLTSNASNQSGALSLLGALSQHTNTKSMSDQINDADAADGGKIIRHILGDDTDKEIQSLAAETGMTGADVGKALDSIAPALLSGLSAATSSAAKVDLSDGLDLSDVMAMFGGGRSKRPGLLAALGAGKTEKDDKVNGTALVQTLAALMK